MSAAENKAVFLSYASQDAAAVQRICDALRAAGVEVWFDQNELVGGDAWDAKIRKQIAECTLFVPIISANTQARLEGYFRIEWKLAARRTHAMATAKAFLLPIVIDATHDAEAHVPDEFRDVQWTRLRPSGTGGQARPEEEEMALAKFCARVQTLLGRSAALQPALEPVGRVFDPPSEHLTPSGAGQRPVRPQAHRIPGVGWVAAAAVIAAGTLYFAFKPAPNAGAGTRPPAAENSAAPLSEARKLVAQVWTLLKKTDLSRVELEAAEELCKRAATLDSTDAEVLAAWSQVESWMLYQSAVVSATRRESARTKATRALQLAPDSFEARLAQACFLVRGRGDRGKPDNPAEVESTFRILLGERPAEPRALLALGILQRNTRQDEAARSTLEALAQNPDYAALAWNEIGWLAFHRRDFRTADVAADKSIALQRYWGNLYLRIYLALFWHGDREKARVAYSQMPPSFLQEEQARDFTVFVSRYLRDSALTLRTLAEMPQDWLSGRYRGPKAAYAADAHEQEGRADAARAEREAALKVVEQRLNAQPNDPELLLWKGRVLARLGRRSEAEKFLRLAQELSPQRTGRGDYFDPLELGQFDDVLDGLEQAAAGPEWNFNFTASWLRLEPRFDPLRSMARFQALQARLDADPRFSPTAKESSPIGAPAPAEKSVAVLPFANVGGDKDNEAFSDGITDELISVLGRVPGLTVKARTSSFFFKGSSAPAREKGQKLGAAYLVDGSVRRLGDKVRITAQLIRAATEENVWTLEPLTDDTKDVFAVQEKIAGLIAQRLSLKLGAGSAASTAAVKPEAFELYVQARQAWGLRTPEGFAQAELLLNRTLEVEPNFARAHAALADVWTTSAGASASLGHFRLRGSATIQKSTMAARRAIVLDPNLAEAHAALGNVHWNNWQIAEAIVKLRQAVTLNSNYAAAHHFLGRVLATDGQMDEALAALRRAHELEPLAHKIADNLGLVLYSAGRHREALALADRALALQPDSKQAWIIRAWALAELGENERAIAAVHQVSGNTPATLNATAAFALARAGARGEAQAMLQRIEPADRSACAAAALLVLGQTDECWHVLEQGSRSILSAETLLFWPVFDSIRGDLRFQRMLADLGLTEAHERAQAWRKAHPPEKPAAKP